MNQLKELLDAVTERNPKRVLLQLPDGLLRKSSEIEESLFNEGIEAFISLEPCYGACDVRDCEAQRLGCDLLVHLGHSDFGVHTKVPVLYFEWKIDFDPVPFLQKDFSKLENFEKIGLVSSVNYVDSLRKAKEYLERNGKECFVEKTLQHPGQVLGCDVSAGLEVDKKADCVLFIGSGEFHALGLALKAHNPVFSLKEEKEGLVQVNSDKFVRQREAARALAIDCRKFGILVSTKPGQMNVKKALRVKKELENNGKEARIFTMDLISREKLLGLGLDCYVNCACPRIAMENRTSFGKPILNPDELP